MTEPTCPQCGSFVVALISGGDYRCFNCNNLWQMDTRELEGSDDDDVDD